MLFEWLNDDSRSFLKDGYLKEGVEPEERIKEIAHTAQRILGLPGFADKFYKYMGEGYYSLSSPVWSNFGTNKGLPISCFGSDIDDNMGSILYTQGEIGMMSKFGGGTSGYFGKIRGRGAKITDNGESSGSVHFMELFESIINVVAQGCYDDKTEVLTDKGFMKFEDVLKDKTIKVAQVSDDDVVEYVQPLDYMKFKPKDNTLLLFKDSKNIDLLVTKNHNMVYKREQKVRTEDGGYNRIIREGYEVSEAEYAPLHRDIKYSHGSLLPSRGEDSGLTDLDRLYIATQADGSVVKRDKGDYVRFHLSKERKVTRLEEIISGLDFEYKIEETSQGSTRVVVYTGYAVPKTFKEWVDISSVSYEWATEFLDEVAHWDGSIKNEVDKSFSYCSIVESNVDVVQELASLVGAKSRKSENNRVKEPSKSTIYTVYVTRRNKYFGVENLKATEVHYDGYVYCVEVPSNKLIVRRNGHTVVCGNSTRRGAFSPYLPIEHPDIEEFLQIGKEGHPIQKLTHGVTVKDEWLKDMIDGDADKRALWAKVIQSREEIGYPYIFFYDNVNNNAADVYKDKKLPINHSNLCSEITLPNNENWSFVCNLSSMNLLKYDEWKNTDAVETMIFFLDAVMTEFLDKLEAMRDSGDKEQEQAFYYMQRPYNFAKANRALGLGVLGWHTYLQSKMIPFESIEATTINAEIFKLMRDKAYAASKELAEVYGEPEILKGYGRRNATLLAVAPTKSSSFILGQVSQGIEPNRSNVFVKDLAKTKKTFRNPYLKEALAKHGKDTREVWNSIRDNDGSVQHLDFLTSHEKDVFKTFGEIDQYVVIDQAAIRQQFIDQSQSLNLMINPDVSAKEINELYLFAWRNGVKTLYYQHGTNAAQQFSKDLLCMACEA